MQLYCQFLTVCFWRFLLVVLMCWWSWCEMRWGAGWKDVQYQTYQYQISAYVRTLSLLSLSLFPSLPHRAWEQQPCSTCEWQLISRGNHPAFKWGAGISDSPTFPLPSPSPPPSRLAHPPAVLPLTPYSVEQWQAGLQLPPGAVRLTLSLLPGKGNTPVTLTSYLRTTLPLTAISTAPLFPWQQAQLSSLSIRQHLTGESERKRENKRAILTLPFKFKGPKKEHKMCKLKRLLCKAIHFLRYLSKYYEYTIQHRAHNPSWFAEAKFELTFTHTVIISCCSFFPLSCSWLSPEVKKYIASFQDAQPQFL